MQTGRGSETDSSPIPTEQEAPPLLSATTPEHQDFEAQEMVTEGDTSPTGIAQEEQGTEGTAPQEGPHWDASLLEELAKPFGDGVVIGVDFSTGQAGAVLWGDSKQQFQTLEVAAQMILETLQQMQPQVVVPERKLIVAP